MLRFQHFTIGWAWTSDYGSSDDAADVATLLAYSPYHNVREGERYPATLITTGDHDDRVFPAHSFKFAAALQHAQGGTAPILLRIETKTGHGAGKPTAKLIDEVADRYAFLVKVLGDRAASVAARPAVTRGVRTDVEPVRKSPALGRGVRGVAADVSGCGVGRCAGRGDGEPRYGRGSTMITGARQPWRGRRSRAAPGDWALERRRSSRPRRRRRRAVSTAPSGEACSPVLGSRRVVGHPGFEPGTSCLSSMRSNQLS